MAKSTPTTQAEEQSTDRTAVAVRNTAELPGVKALLNRLDIEAGLADEQGPVTQLSIMESMLVAESEEELFAAQEAGTTSSQDFLNRPFRLSRGGIEFKRARPEFVSQGGFPFYAILQVEDMQSGERRVVSSGSYSVLAVLNKLLEFDDDSRDFERRSFAPFEDEGGRPFMFVGKSAPNGTVVTMVPVRL